MRVERAEQYAEALFGGKGDPDLERALASIKERNMPDISVKPGYGRLLTLLAASSGASAALEIGALAGYSGICLARGLRPGGTLTSLELKPEYAELAKANLTAAGFGDVVEYRVGEALANLETLASEGKTFDFFFIDADKGNYPNYLDWALKLGRPGAIVVGDNVLLKGRIVEEESTSPSVRAMRVFNERIATDPRLQGVILPAYDGLSIARIV
ncbi:O-methyltransferase [Paenibacillus antri]|uniref:O-methyltransferase n=1 Tax=Paenibacillus antri TaxID=2582848 RepID=A0A5R9GGG6_9BACL|nr:O-methyltransferase [Paenibacillus antri]TLS54319.1 O-methyltransferase [Paenibacillus antri]